MGAIRNLDIKSLKERHGCQIFIETGSGYGTGIYHALQFNFGSILSVEIDKEQASLLHQFFRFDDRVRIFNGKSKDFLNYIVPKIDIDIACLIFLDAHFPGADLNKSGFSDEKDESIRMPLFEELKIIKARADKGVKDLIIVDDIMLYDDENVYEASSQKETMDILPRQHRNYLDKFIDLFKNTHSHSILKSEQGWLILEPK